jgi:hypothetical protein
VLQAGNTLRVAALASLDGPAGILLQAGASRCGPQAAARRAPRVFPRDRSGKEVWPSGLRL